jgi:hypothetical protein
MERLSPSQEDNSNESFPPLFIDDRDASSNLFGQLLNDDKDVGQFTEPLASTAALLERVSQFIPQIRDANKELDWNSESFIEIIDKNEDIDKSRKRKRESRPMIEMNLAMGILEERERKRPNFVTMLGEQSSDNFDDDTELDIELPNFTKQNIQRKNEEDNENAMLNIMGALFDVDDSDEEAEYGSDDEQEEEDKKSESGSEEEDDDDAERSSENKSQNDEN